MSRRTLDRMANSTTTPRPRGPRWSQTSAGWRACAVLVVPNHTRCWIARRSNADTASRAVAPSGKPTATCTRWSSGKGDMHQPSSQIGLGCARSACLARTLGDSHPALSRCWRPPCRSEAGERNAPTPWAVVRCSLGYGSAERSAKRCKRTPRGAGAPTPTAALGAPQANVQA